MHPVPVSFGWNHQRRVSGDHGAPLVGRLGQPAVSGVAEGLFLPLLRLRDAYAAAVEEVETIARGLDRLVEGVRTAGKAGSDVEKPRDGPPAVPSPGIIELDVYDGDDANLLGFLDRLGEMEGVTRVSVVGAEHGHLRVLVERGEETPPTVVCASCGKVLAAGGPAVSHGLCRQCAEAWRLED